MKEKRPYIALNFDLKKFPRYYEYEEKTLGEDGLEIVKPIKKIIGFEKHFSNKQWALYCSCSHRTTFPVELIKNDSEGDIVSEHPLECSGCNKVYTSLSDVKMIYSRFPESNIISRRFRVVERDNCYALYSFSTTVFVSVTTKKLIFRDRIGSTLYLSKNSDTIRTSINDKLISVPFKNISKHVCNAIDNMSENLVYTNIISDGLFEHQVINPLLKFCKIIESKCDKRDVERILAILDKEKDDVYFNSFFRELNNYPHRDSFIFKGNCSYNIDILSNSKSYVSQIRCIWMQYFKRRLSIMLAIAVYPPMSTIVLSYGIDKTISLLMSHSSLMCSLTNLKRKKPTNPKDIVEVMFKDKITNELAKFNYIKKYISKEELKRKRKLKAHPENKNLLQPIFSHPTKIVDTRIPITKNIKKEVKNFNFRKFYTDLFFQKTFDSACEIFYAIFRNKSAFKDLKTIDKIILNNKPEYAHALLTGIQTVYESYYQRLGSFKMDYKFVCHFLKITKTSHHSNVSLLTRYFSTYADTVSMLNNMEINLSDLFKIKNIEELENLHNSLNQAYKLVSDKKLSVELEEHLKSFRHTEGVFDSISFYLLDTPEKFYEESSAMNHCVKTYFTNVARGYFVIYSIEDTLTGDRATLSISIDKSEKAKNVFTFNQLKAKNNRKTTSKIIEYVKEFIERNFKINNVSNSYDLQYEMVVENKEIEDLVLENHNYNGQIVEPYEPNNYEVNNNAEIFNEDDELPF